MKKITVIGTGYVGLVSGAGISDFGNNVCCSDINKEKIELLNKGVMPIYEPSLDELVNRNIKSKRLKFSYNIEDSIQSAEVIFIAVGTPENKVGDVDLTNVLQVAELIGKNLNNYKVICTKSTVPVGTGKKIIDEINKYNQNNIEFDYCSNPEFLREGKAVSDFLHPDRIVLGVTSKKAYDYMKDVYRTLYINKTPLIHTTIETAEMIKYAANAFLALKISYINEVANLCDEIGADINIVTEALGSDGRISPKFLHPGPGFGGSCFPKDTKALIHIAKKYNLDMHTVDAAIKANNYQKIRMLNKLEILLEGNFSKKKIGILGLAFKQGTDDVRESAAIDMISGLIKRGANIKAYDPVANDSMKKLIPKIDYKLNWQSAVEDCDAVVIMTEWNEFRGMDLSKLKELMFSPIILDTRNILNITELKRLDFKFDNVGRK
ncbi:MAG: UDP-glucose/GDP-mannose dehydrogenase family protein [Candidatus Neomarinimicrobiota bacterium]|nr:UDP-glucose/GDP-mannose dehydrogenase family protein [Candidatus Neomarinimicrobiota bacterium]